MDIPVVAIVGRPNVGKSQLFNRMTGKMHSIVQDEPGITRDRIYSECEWSGKVCMLVDTGGIDDTESDPVKIMAQKQVDTALKEAELILFVVDGKLGLSGEDSEIAVRLRRLKKPIILVANKLDDPEKNYMAAEFNALGLGEPFCISAMHGISVGDLMDLIFSKLHFKAGAPTKKLPKIVLAGRRNVGKSSMLNAFTGEMRSIVHEEGGTTRDCVESPIELNGVNFTLTDTSGLRKRVRMNEKAEYYSSIRTLQAIRDAELTILVLSCEDGVVEQDLKVAHQIQEAQRASIIVFNKWDIFEKKLNRQALAEKKKKLLEGIEGELHFLQYSPVVFTSAKEGKGLEELIAQVKIVLEEYHKKIETPILNRVIRDAQNMRPAPSYKGEQLNIFYAAQIGIAPPVINMNVNSDKLIHFSYKRYLENSLRKAFKFTGSPLVLKFKNKKGK